MADIGLFIGALAVAYLVPGPDMLLLLETGAAKGRRHALAVAAGLACARAAHVVLAAAGLAALLTATPLGFEMIRFAGAVYLIWLGVSVLLAGVPATATGGGVADRRPRAYGAAALRGFLTNITNPKALLFCSVLLPQFVQPDRAGIAGQFLILGAILVGVGLAFDIIYASLGNLIGRWIARHCVIGAVQRWLFGIALIGFGLRPALMPRIA